MKKYSVFILLLTLFAAPCVQASALIDAVKEGDVEQTKSLLDQGEDVNFVNSQGNTALHYAVVMDNAELVSLLLEYGADKNVQNAKQWSPLMMAEKKNTEAVVAALSTEAKPKVLEIPQKTTVITWESPLSDRVQKGDEEIVYCLNYLGLQGEQKNMVSAAAYFAADVGISKKRHDEIVRISKEYYENASAENIKNKADVCAGFMTPKEVSKQNQIIRSLNKSMGY